VIPAITDALKDQVAPVRNEAALALSRYLAECLKKRGSGMIEQFRSAVTSLIEAVRQDGDSTVRASAAFATASLVHEIKDAGFDWANARGEDPLDPRTLVKVLDAVLEREPEARLSLLVSYRRLGPVDEPAPSGLLAALDDSSRIVRIEALQAIAEFTSGADKAVSVLLTDAESAPGESPFNQWRYIYPLRQAAERLHPSAAVIPLLIAGLQSPNPDVREVAVVLLRPLGPAARPATGALMSATRSMIRSAKRTPERGEDPFFSEFASTMVQIAPAEDVIAVLSEALDPGHPETGAHAAWFIGKLGPKGCTAVPILLKALKDAGDPPEGQPSEEYAHAILRSLGDIAPGAELPKPTADEVIEVLSRALDYPQEFIRRTAATALGDFGPCAARMLPRLRALSENGQASREVREAAANSVRTIEQALGQGSA
jgi:HEAT repeat protein